MRINPAEPLETILLKLISINSPTGKEEEISNDLFSTLVNLTKFNIEKIGNNLIATYNINESYSNIALFGHIDTVPKAKKQIEGYTNGFIYGRGATDMKSGLACMLKSAHEINNEIITPKNNITFVFYDAEEGKLENNGVKKLLDQNKINKLDFAYVLEPTEGNYAIGNMGQIVAHLHFSGRAKHSAFPWDADNAMNHALDTMNKIRKISFKESSYKGLIFRESIKMTQAYTHNAANIIPDDFRITVDYRFGPNKSVDEAKDHIFKRFKDEALIQIKDECPSGYVDLKKSKFLSFENKRVIFPGYADSAQLMAKGIPSICYGPGSLGVAHCYDENINSKELNNFYNKLVKHL